MSGHKSAYDMNENGSAKDPEAFRAALRADPQRMAALQVWASCGRETMLAIIEVNHTFLTETVIPSE